MDLGLKILRMEHKEFQTKDKTVARRLLALIELCKKKKFSVSFWELDFILVGEKFNVTGRTVRNWFRAYSTS